MRVIHFVCFQFNNLITMTKLCMIMINNGLLSHGLMFFSVKNYSISFSFTALKNVLQYYKI